MPDQDPYAAAPDVKQSDPYASAPNADPYSSAPDAPGIKPYQQIINFASKYDFHPPDSNPNGKSIMGGGHARNSEHYSGNAVDLRSKYKTPLQLKDFINSALQAGYSVEDATNDPNQPHIHLQTGPFKGGQRYITSGYQGVLTVPPRETATPTPPDEQFAVNPGNQEETGRETGPINTPSRGLSLEGLGQLGMQTITGVTKGAAGLGELVAKENQALTNKILPPIDLHPNPTSILANVADSLVHSAYQVQQGAADIPGALVGGALSLPDAVRRYVIPTVQEVKAGQDTTGAAVHGLTSPLTRPFTNPYDPNITRETVSNAPGIVLSVAGMGKMAESLIHGTPVTPEGESNAIPEQSASRVPVQPEAQGSGGIRQENPQAGIPEPAGARQEPEGQTEAPTTLGGNAGRNEPVPPQETQEINLQTPTGQVRLRKADIASLADSVGLKLQPNDAADTMQALLNRSTANFNDINASLPKNKLQVNNNLSSEQRVVGRMRLEQLGEETSALLTQHGSAEGPAKDTISGQIDQNLQQMEAISNSIYKTNRQLGRDLAFTKTIVQGPLDPAGIQLMAEKISDGNLNPAQRARLVGLSTKAKTIVTSFEDQANSALARLEQMGGAKDVTVEEIMGCH